MELKLKRAYKKKEYTIGKLYIDGAYYSSKIENVVLYILYGKEIRMAK